jgi:anti-anti-sigma regulatory factor
LTANGALTISTKTLSGGVLHVEMRGKINEHFDPSRVVAEAAGARVVIDLSGVRHVSSIGIREFERFLEKLQDVTLAEVSPAIATQLVLLPTLAARVKVESAQLPFACEHCGAERSATVPFAVGAAVSHAPTCACGQKMSLDGIAEQYLPS